ncbi:MAG: NINE protein [Lachnospiraceae bacterium]|nr:NINE protein [Lachnospiraceae bacterium]
MGKRKKNEVSLEEMVALEEELHQLKEQYGIEEKEGRVSRGISRWLNKREARVRAKVPKKKYLLTALFTGWMGGHHFLTKRYPLAFVYLALFWSGFPMAMTIIDLLEAIPKQADENGMIEI